MIDTIAALATAPGYAGVAIIRVSGERSLAILESITALKNPTHGKLYFRQFITDVKVDTGLCVYFKAPNSFTGEDIIEFHVHGSTAIINKLLEFITQQPHCRLAKPGEFSRRAFLNDKMDLTEAEALLDLIHADTELQRLQAYNGLNGRFKEQCLEWKTILLKQSAIIESLIDFSDEELSHELNWIDESERVFTHLHGEIEILLKKSSVSERLRDGFKIVLSGKPNVGKSTLINKLVEREVSIVTPIPGTTRDIMEVKLDIAGYPVILSDTAGLRESSDLVELKGIERANQAIEQADIHVKIVDEMSECSREIMADIIVLNKIDTHKNYQNIENCIPVSARQGMGLEKLIEVITKKLQQLYQPANTPAVTRKRQKDLLIATNDALSKVIENCENQAPLELLAEDIRIAVQRISEIVGVVDVEEMLDQLFSQFCIGK